ncbi:hypothetical protein JM18_001102 [Phytophthora kernoviae]|uniref:F-box domain-containing protein n=2 Tax=Phytophthora kernoviae TaxID=325452 RepID=A0A8T0M8C5_9STRA|nr:hypothetical protein G195_004758 [Phytophthora kernoviae 00238/432]KAG2531553.1 hypothetical protein JM16_001020 [Phytophthora kernoviae]KAG2532517.1 hypothetical protein JM18_001102 [Phytophthora kernoviae]
MGLCDLPCDLLAATLQFADHSTLLQLESVCRHVQDVMVQFDDGKLGTLVYESMEYNVVKDMEVPVYSNEERLAFRLSEHDAGIAALAFSDDERLLCSVGSPEDGPRLYIWDVMTGNICATHQKISNIVTAVAFGGMARDVKRRDTANYQFATVGHRLLVIWVLNPVTGELTQSKIEQMLVRDYTCVQFSPDFETLVAGSSSGDFSVVGVKTRQLFKVVPACSCGVNSILYFDGGMLVGGGDGSVLHYSHDFVDTCHVALDSGVVGLALNAAKTEAVAGWSDGCIRSHGSDSGELAWSIDSAHTGGVTALVLSHNQRFIVSAGVGGEIRVWDVRKRDLVAHLKEHSMTVTNLALYRDDQHLISCSRDRSLLCWDLRSERRISSHIQRMGGINTVALSSDQRLVLSAGQEKRISYWDLRIDTPVTVIQKAHEEEATCIAVAHNLDVFATGGNDRLVKLWDYNTSQLIMDGVGHSGNVRGLAFSPDDRQLVSVGDDGCVFVWNVYTDQ